MNVSKLSAIANRLLDLAADVESGKTYVGFDTLVQLSQEITAAIEAEKVNKVHDCWEQLKGITGNLSPPPSPKCKSCNSPQKVSFELK
jgi:hypothetical protein